MQFASAASGPKVPYNRAVQGAATQLSLFSDSHEPDPVSGFSVRESGRAKRLSIKVFPRGRVEVVVPRRTRARTVREFVEAHRDWINDARARFAEEHTPEPFELPSQVVVDAIGRRFRVDYRKQPGSNTVRHRVKDDEVLLVGQTDDEQLCVLALKRWLSALARTEYAPRLRALATLTGTSYQRMHVRGQRTCWGSHSGKGTISLNYCLLFLDSEHLRYVMIHELCHAAHMNHSSRFWRLVGQFEPDYRRLDKSLNQCWKKIPTWVGLY